MGGEEAAQQQANFVYPKLKVESPNVKLVQEGAEVELESEFEYANVRVEREPSGHSIKVSYQATIERVKRRIVRARP